MSVPVTSTASSPATLIAEIPGILGFYPEDSVVFCTLISTESRTTHRLGPVMRMDCGDTASLEEIAAYTAQADPDMTFVVLVTESPDHAFIQAIAEAGITALDIIWHVTNIGEDEPYRAVWTADRRERLNPVFLEGVVAPIHQAASTQAALANGEMIAASRDDLMAGLTFDEDHREDGAATYVLAEDLLAAAPSPQHIALALRETLRLCRNTTPRVLSSQRCLMVSVPVTSCWANSSTSQSKPSWY